MEHPRQESRCFDQSVMMLCQLSFGVYEVDHASLLQTVGVFYKLGIPLVLGSQVLLHLSVKALACPVQQKYQLVMPKRKTVLLNDCRQNFPLHGCSG